MANVAWRDAEFQSNWVPCPKTTINRHRSTAEKFVVSSMGCTEMVGMTQHVQAEKQLNTLI